MNLALASPAFNETFYATAATVIPVLFVALLFAGGPLRPYSVWVKRWRQRKLAAVMLANPRPKWWSVRAAGLLRLTDVMQLVVSFVLLAASVGEASAFIALDHRYATTGEHSYVLWSVVGLPFLAAVVMMASISLESFEPLNDGGVPTGPETDTSEGIGELPSARKEPTMNPVHSTLAGEEDNPKHHTKSNCPHYKELVDDGHVAQGTGGYPLCDWCATH